MALVGLPSGFRGVPTSITEQGSGTLVLAKEKSSDRISILSSRFRMLTNFHDNILALQITAIYTASVMFLNAPFTTVSHLCVGNATKRYNIDATVISHPTLSNNRTTNL